MDKNKLCHEDKSIVLVDSVSADSVAAAAGMLPGDRLILINNVRIDSVDAVGVHKNSADMVCKVLRGGQEITLTTTKLSADSRLGMTVKAGVNRVGIEALCEGVRQSNIRSLR